MSADQKLLKRACKTGPYKVTWRRNYAWETGISMPPENVRNSWKAAREVRETKLAITAALNLYHEVRGSPYRHGVANENKFAYNKIMADMREALTKTPTKI